MTGYPLALSASSKMGWQASTQINLPRERLSWQNFQTIKFLELSEPEGPGAGLLSLVRIEASNLMIPLQYV
jgi:hypothetical protein